MNLGWMGAYVHQIDLVQIREPVPAPILIPSAMSEEGEDDKKDKAGQDRAEEDSEGQQGVSRAKVRPSCPSLLIRSRLPLLFFTELCSLISWSSFRTSAAGSGQPTFWRPLRLRSLVTP